MINAFNKVGVERTFFNIRKTIYDKPTYNIIVLRTTMLPLKSRHRG